MREKLWFGLDIYPSAKYTALIFTIEDYIVHYIEGESYKLHNEQNLLTIRQLLISVPFSSTSVLMLEL
jgi:hypothetical protein